MIFFAQFIMVIILIGCTEVFRLLPLTSSVTPWLLPVFLLLLTVRQEESHAQVLAVIGGIVWELFSGLPIGSFSFSLLLTHRVWHWFYHSISFYNFNWKQFPVIVALTWIMLFAWLLGYTALLGSITSVTVPAFGLLLSKAPQSFLMTLVFSPLVYLIYIVFEQLVSYLSAMNRRV